ncbi:MAG: DUF2975 domain-containing protein [Pirellulales bacterium]|nr:DUF2975 domain-containing protein [Pirellulales bacterium]
MQRSATAFLQFVVVLVGAGALAFLLWEPHLEGRNAHATPFEVYFHDPFLAYAYVASLAFFWALYQAFKVLGYAGRQEMFTPAAAQALRTIRHCAFALVGFVAIGEAFLLRHSDDLPQGIVMGGLLAFGALVIAAAAATLERIVRQGTALNPPGPISSSN